MKSQRGVTTNKPSLEVTFKIIYYDLVEVRGLSFFG